MSKFLDEQVSDDRLEDVRAIGVGGLGALHALKLIDAKIKALAVQQ